MKRQHPFERHVDNAEKALKGYRDSVAVAVKATADTLKAFGVPNYQAAKILEMDDSYFSDLMAGKYRFPAAKAVRLFNAVLIEVQKRDPADKASGRQAACLHNMIERWHQAHKAWTQLAAPIFKALGMWADELDSQELSEEAALPWLAEVDQVKTIAKEMEAHGKVMEGFTLFRTHLRRSFVDVENGAPFVRIELPSAWGAA